MRSFLCLVVFSLLILATPARARNDSLTLLGPLNMRPAGGGAPRTFGTGTVAEVLKVNKDTITLTIAGEAYEVPKEKAAYYFEAGDASSRYILGEALGALKNPALLEVAPGCFTPAKPGGDPCPWKTETPAAWSDSLARQALLRCQAEPAGVVPRLPSGEFSEACRNKLGPSGPSAEGWASCAPPPTCPPAQDKLKRRQAEWRRLDAERSCTQRPKVAREIEKEERCLLPFREPIRKLVIHQTDAPAFRGPDAVYNWHRDRGYDDMSYHYVIAKDASGRWRAFEGRSRKYEGAHGGPGANKDSLGIVIAGCFRTGNSTATRPCREEDRPSPEAVRVLNNLVAQLKKEIKGPDGKPSITAVEGHGEHRFGQTHCHTDCPSPSCQLLVHALRQRYFPEVKK